MLAVCPGDVPLRYSRRRDERRPYVADGGVGCANTVNDAGRVGAL